MALPIRTLLRLVPQAPPHLRTLAKSIHSPSLPRFLNNKCNNKRTTIISRPTLPHNSHRNPNPNPRFHSSKPPPNPHNNHQNTHNPPQTPLSLSARLRKLSREYGWAAFGVYIALSALDFPFSFMAVRYIGADKIGHYEHVVVSHVAGLLPEQAKIVWREGRERVGEIVRGLWGKGGSTGSVVNGGEKRPWSGKAQGKVEDVSGVVAPDADTAAAAAAAAAALAGRDPETGIVTSAATGDFGQEVKAAEQLNKSENASIWTQLALAYAIHKSFIFVRVPLTVAVTPRVVKLLRGWGWDIGKRRSKAVREASKAARTKAREKKRRGGGGSSSSS